MKVRAIGTAEAQGDVARRGAARREAADRATDAARRVVSEGTDGLPVTYGSWLTHQLALRQQLRAAEAEAAAQEDRARAALVEARRAERIVDRLAELRAQAERREARRREAAALDEAASRRRA